MINDKLGAELESTGPQKPIELRFTDYSINKYKPNFKGKKEIKVPIIDSGIKGLKLKFLKSKRSKFFIQNFWFHNVSDYRTVGEFRKGIFGIKECQTKVVAIIRLDYSTFQ